MAQADIYGPSLSLPRIERQVMAWAREWYPHYLRNQEREDAVGPDGKPLVVGRIPTFRSFRVASEVAKWPSAELPALLFSSPGLGDEERRKSGDGRHSGEWVITLTAVARGSDEVWTRFLVGTMTAALRLMVIQQAGAIDLPVNGFAYEDEAYDPIPQYRARSLLGGSVSFTLLLGDLGNARFGPADPPADPTEDPGTWPEVQTTETLLTRRPIE